MPERKSSDKFYIQGAMAGAVIIGLNTERVGENPTLQDLVDFLIHKNISPHKVRFREGTLLSVLIEPENCRTVDEICSAPIVGEAVQFREVCMTPGVYRLRSGPRSPALVVNRDFSVRYVNYGRTEMIDPKEYFSDMVWRTEMGVLDKILIKK